MEKQEKHTSVRACFHAHPYHTHHMPWMSIPYPSHALHGKYHACARGVGGMCWAYDGYDRRTGGMCRSTTRKNMKKTEKIGKQMKVRACIHVPPSHTPNTPLLSLTYPYHTHRDMGNACVRCMLGHVISMRWV